MIQTTCIIILGTISLLALNDLRKKTKELDRLKEHFSYKADDKIEEVKQSYETDSDIKKIIMQNNNLRIQVNVITTILIIMFIMLWILFFPFVREYAKTHNINSPMNTSFENTEN